MLKPLKNKKGIALFMALGTLFVVIILANVMLTIMLSQSRLTHHQVRRIQAYYASLAGINLALEGVRLNDPTWISNLGTGSTHTLCNTTLNPGCGDIDEPDLPVAIHDVLITVGAPGSGIDGTREVSARATYTYTP